MTATTGPGKFTRSPRPPPGRAVGCLHPAGTLGGLGSSQPAGHEAVSSLKVRTHWYDPLAWLRAAPVPMGHLQGSVLPVGTSHHSPSASGLEGQTFPNLAKQCHPKLLEASVAKTHFQGFSMHPLLLPPRSRCFLGMKQVDAVCGLLSWVCQLCPPWCEVLDGWVYPSIHGRWR